MSNQNLLFEQYDYISGNPIGYITEFNFDDIIQKQHCTKPIVFRALATDATISNLKIYLDNKGSIPSTKFGYYTDATFYPAIESGSNLIVDFIETPDASTTSPNPALIGWDASSIYSHYVWLDVQIEKQGSSSIGSISDATFKLFFDFE